ncbi:MAG: transposase family protein [Candidatus Nitrosocosmicus sp.]
MTIYSIYKKNHPVTHKQVVNVLDLGYLSIEKDYPTEQLSALPYKKKRNQDLSQEEKEYNKIHSRKKRIVIEHTICRLKK